jgi:hypothetical protein
VANEFGMEVRYTPLVAHFSFDYFQDLNGIEYDGVQLSKTSLSGSGDLSGVIDWWLRGSDDPSDVALRGTLDYEGVHVKNGTAASGEYTFTVRGYPPRMVSYALAADIDLRRVLPVEAP